jgi:hypothetical protein
MLIPFADKWAQPMRLALKGESGVMIGLDYHGVEALAAFEPINIIGFGLVTKIDLSEIREPFIKASLIALAVALLAILISSTFFIDHPAYYTTDGTTGRNFSGRCRHHS